MSNDNSNITTLLLPDDPILLDASYRLDSHDRRYLDQQALGAQHHLVDSLLSGLTATWGTLDAGSPAVIVGDILCVSGINVTKATAANLLTSGAQAGVCLLATQPNQKVRYAISGMLPPAISGLGSGVVSLVRISATARAERVALYASTDFPVGICDVNGAVTLSMGAPALQTVKVTTTAVTAN